MNKTLLSILVLFLLLRVLVGSAYHAVSTPGVDIRIFYNAAERLNQGNSLYEKDPFNGYLYTPALAIMLQPISKNGLDFTSKTWTLLSCALILISVLIFTYSKDIKLHAIGPIALLLLVSYRFWPTTTNLWLGQTNFILLLSLSLLILAQSRDKWIWFSVVIAIATIMKTWMIGFILYLIINKRWKEVAYCIGFLAVGLLALFLYVGPHELPHFVAVTRNNAIQSEKVSHSLIGVLRMHLTDYGGMPAKIDSQFAYWMAIAFSIIILSAAVLWLYLTKPSVDKEEKTLRLSFFTATMLLGMPLCHREYMVLALPLIWCLLTLSVKTTYWNIGLAIAGFGVYLTFTRGWPDNGFDPNIYGSGLKSFLINMHFFGLLMLWVLGWIAILLIRTGKADSTSNRNTR